MRTQSLVLSLLTLLVALCAGTAVGDETPADVDPVTVVDEEAPAAAEGDDAWSAFLATLPVEGGATSSGDTTLTPTTTAAVGNPTMSPQLRRNAVIALAVLAMMGLLAVPTTRRLLLGRLRGESASAASDVTISVRASETVGHGQRIVALDVDGQRLLVGMSPGRMDVLHTWFDAPITEVAPSPRAAAPSVQARSSEPAPTTEDQSAAVSVVEAVLRERADEGAPSVSRLVDAWRRIESLPDEVEEEPEGPEALPWWLEGATDDEIEKHDEVEQAPDLSTIRMPFQTRRPAKPEPAAEAPAPARTGTDGWRGAARFVLLVATAVLLPSVLGWDVAAAAEAIEPAMRFEVAGDAGGSNALRLLATLTLLAVAPALILAMTSFTRLIVVFSLLRQAIGVQQAPPNQVLIGMALFLTWFVMGPTFERVHEHALAPWMDGEITEGQALETAMVPMREFMFRNTRDKDLGLFLRLDRSPRPETRAQVPSRVLVPAFLISELKTAFQIGFLLYIPFLVIDIVVATVLLAMGMMVLPPVVISLPFKLLLFVFVDGWNLLVGSLVSSFA